MIEKKKVASRRKKFLINPQFQLKFIRNLLCLNIFVCGVFFTAQSYFFWQGKELARSVPLPPDHVFFRFLEEQQHSMTTISLVTMILVSMFIVGFSLMYSHRIAGPIFRLQKYLKERLEGTEKGDMRLREDDYFQEIAQSINDFVSCEKEKTIKEDSKPNKKVA